MPPTELRIVLTVENHEQAVALFRDTLGLSELADWSGEQGKVVLLDGGRATLELVDASQASFIDEIEIGRRESGVVRVALGLDDVDGIAARTELPGAEPVSGPVDTPWGDRNLRLRTADGVQLTLFSSSG
jgi:catechol 2,3-dioxygenase-like lactoylglutathione lyase family enzyme